MLWSKIRRKKKKKKTQTDRYTGSKAAAVDPENQNMPNLCPDSKASLQKKMLWTKIRRKKRKHRQTDSLELRLQQQTHRTKTCPIYARTLMPHCRKKK